MQLLENKGAFLPSVLHTSSENDVYYIKLQVHCTVKYRKKNLI